MYQALPLYPLFYWTFATTFWGRCYYFPHFIKESETLRSLPKVIELGFISGQTYCRTCPLHRSVPHSSGNKIWDIENHLLYKDFNEFIECLWEESSYSVYKGDLRGSQTINIIKGRMSSGYTGGTDKVPWKHRTQKDSRQAGNQQWLPRGGGICNLLNDK